MTDEKIPTILRDYKQILIVGLSPDRNKPSHYVPRYMRDNGYRVRGVHPETQPEFETYRDLSAVPREWLRFVVVFRRPEFIPDLVSELLALSETQVLWLQLGITHPASEQVAAEAGLMVVSDRCLMVEHRALAQD